MSTINTFSILLCLSLQIIFNNEVHNVLIAVVEISYYACVYLFIFNL